MARIAKPGLSYFPLQVDIFNDIKIRKLIKYQGGKALSVYISLLCRIYETGYYLKWDEDVPFLCREVTGYDEEYIREVIKTCLTVGLFSQEMYDKEHILTSRGIQKRYALVCRVSRKTCSNIVDDYNLLPEQPPAAGYKLDREIEAMKNDKCWIDRMCANYHLDEDLLRDRIDGFRAECIANGKDRHSSLQEAKQHCNSWLRKITEIKNTKNERNRSNQRRTIVLDTNQKKNYEGTF